MEVVRYNMWVSDVSLEENYLYAEGYKEGDSDSYRFEMTINLDELKENVSESDFNELIDMNQVNSRSVRILPDMRTGRVFILESCGDKEKIIIPKYKPFTKEDRESAKKEAEKWMKHFKWR